MVKDVAELFQCSSLLAHLLVAWSFSPSQRCWALQRKQVVCCFSEHLAHSKRRVQKYSKHSRSLSEGSQHFLVTLD